ncbi:TetR family transcriptional regulator [Glaciibacter flavus]|uniref:TetR family transcriptional regulator n=1 Tax=Orlajensenia flava TaxID=2565934 RepID=A0A4V3WU22_9MICO|nr:TetR family transcriptional regulator C-terminal domain-containing protein [Glaciibacter flavus]THG34257.1 TetR family transcriptional regulator [Glaciibacter flavus]
MSTPDRRRAARLSPDERSATLRATAREVALEGGLPAVTLRGVASRAGVAPALVAHYEPSMDALVARTFSVITLDEIDEVFALVATEPSPTGRLRALIATLLDDGRDDVTAVWADAWSMGRRNAALAEAVREVMDRWQAAVVDVVRDGCDAGEFTAEDAELVAWQFLGMIDGVNSHALVHYGGARDRGRLVYRAMENELGLPTGALG